MKFVKCTTDGDEVIYVNLKAVKRIFREDKVERHTIIETFDGKTYDCWNDDTGCIKLKGCIIKF